MLGCQTPSENTITVAASANMKFAIKELTSTFKEQTKINCKIVLGSSGKLTAQIEAGAPFDIFLSANAKYPQYLNSKNNTYPTPKTYAYGRLAMFSYNIKMNSLAKMLTSAEVKKIAIPNPKIAPYGQMAKEYLQNIGIYSKIEHKLVYGESVLQSNQFVVSGAADVGFTAISTLQTETIENIQQKVLKANLYTPIQQQLLILTSNTKTQQFAHFMLSKKAQDILKNYGYGSIQ